MTAKMPRIVPTLTEVLEATLPRPKPHSVPVDEEMQALIKRTVDTAMSELHELMLPRVEALVREALLVHQKPVLGGD
jgi:hypothetical protein